MRARPAGWPACSRCWATTPGCGCCTPSTAAAKSARADLATAVGMTQQAVSNQLQHLVDKVVCATRRDGSGIHYRIVDPCVPSLLASGLCLLETPSPAG
jgi:DNA-binding transcriptional ArsR family regulator